MDGQGLTSDGLGSHLYPSSNSTKYSPVAWITKNTWGFHYWIGFTILVAEQLYLTLEHRCDLNNIGTLGMEAGSNKDEFLEMENGKAEAWLRQSAVSTVVGRGRCNHAIVCRQWHNPVCLLRNTQNEKLFQLTWSITRGLRRIFIALKGSEWSWNDQPLV